MSKENRRIIQFGNSKLPKTTGVFNLPPVKTCPNCKDCAATCYAMKAYRMYPSCRSSWGANYDLSKRPEFVDAVCMEIEKLGKKIDVVRIHASGDFYDVQYYEKWIEIAKRNPHISFYAYTKVLPVYARYQENHPANFNLILSFVDGHLNYGDKDFCSHLTEDHGAFLCPAYKGSSVRCGIDCKYCITKSTPCFLIH